MPSIENVPYFEYQPIEGVERLERYRPGGYHPIHIGNVLKGRTSSTKQCRCSKLLPSLQNRDCARALLAELILAVAYIHAQGIVHGDIHLGNALIRLPTSFDRLSVEQLYQKFGEPYTEAVMRLDGKPLPASIPARGTVPVWLGKKANEVTLAEAHLLLSDFGEAFSPTDSLQKRRGDQCHAPLSVLPPEAYFEPDKPLSSPTDIWTLACAIWSIFSSRPLFDATLTTHDDISSQQVDILGPLPLEWWDSWEARHEYLEEREERATAKAVLGSDWMVTWGLPEFEKVRQT
ncbi:hypothetical protein RU639_006683 [Aspergillus parasiticus]